MNVLAVDDHSLFRSGLRFTVEGLKSEVNFLEAASVREAEAVIHEHAVNMTLLDLNMPGSDWEAAISHMQRLLPKGAHIVVISGEDCPRKMKTVQRMGVLGYIPKGLEPNKLNLALQIVLAGESYFPRECLDYEFPETDEAANATLLQQLPPKQRTALNLLTKGYTNKQIANEMFISEATVKSYLSNIFRVFGVSNRTEAVAFAQNLGLDTNS